HGEIGLLTNLERAHSGVGKGRIRGTLCVRSDRIRGRDALRRHIVVASPDRTTLGRTVKRVTGNAGRVRRPPYFTGYSLFDPHERVRRPGTGPIAAERKGCAPFLET